MLAAMWRVWMAGVAIVAGVWAQAPSSVLQQAAQRIQAGNPAEAVAMLEPVVRDNPKDPRALTLLGMALSAAGRVGEAKVQFEAALGVNAAFAPALRGLAMNEMSAGRAREAKTHFLGLLKLTPQEPVAHLALGEIYFNEKNYKLAVQHYEETGGLWVKDPANLLRYASACLSTGQTDKAVAALGQAPAEAEPDFHLQAGLLLVKAARYGAAAAEFEKALPRHPDVYQVGYNLALAQLKADNPKAAVATCEALRARGFRKAELQNLLGQAYEKNGQTREAYGALREATEIDPADEANYLDLIALCIDHKNLDLAGEIAAVGVKRLPGSDRLQLQRGIVWAMKGQFPEAREAFDKAASLAPAKSLPQVALSLVLLQMDQPDEAVRLLRRRTAAGGDDYLLLWFLGEALNRAGAEPDSAEGKEAIAALEKSIRLNPEVAQPRVLLGKMLARRGAVEPAAEQLERALKLEPENTTAMYQLAQVLTKKGETARAKELFAKVSKAKADEREQLTTKGLAQIVREGPK